MRLRSSSKRQRTKGQSNTQGQSKKITPGQSKKLKLSYYNAKRPGSYSGAHSFNVPHISPRLTKQWLSSQSAYNLHTPVIKKILGVK